LPDSMLYVIVVGLILGMFPTLFGWNYNLWNAAALTLGGLSMLPVAAYFVRCRNGERPSIAILPDGIYIRYSVLYRRHFRIPSARIRRLAVASGGKVDRKSVV